MNEHKAVEVAGSWGVETNGVLVVVGVTEAYAKQLCRDLIVAELREERPA